MYGCELWDVARQAPPSSGPATISGHREIPRQAPGGSAREAGTGERWGARNGDRGLIHNALVSAADGRLQRLLRADDAARQRVKTAPRLSAVKALR